MTLRTRTAYNPVSPILGPTIRPKLVSTARSVADESDKWALPTRQGQPLNYVSRHNYREKL